MTPIQTVIPFPVMTGAAALRACQMHAQKITQASNPAQKHWHKIALCQCAKLLMKGA